MSSERQVTYVWTCDACDATEAVDDMGSGRPTSDKGWRHIVFGALHDKLGNLPSHDLCGDCSKVLALLLGNRLGDFGDMAQAWDEGFRAAEHVGETQNPYSALTTPPTTEDSK